MMPRPVATLRMKPRTASGVREFGPSAFSAMPSPEPPSQTKACCKPIPAMMIKIKASPIDLYSTERNAGESICDSACAAASSIVVLRDEEQLGAALVFGKRLRPAAHSVHNPGTVTNRAPAMRRINRRSFLAASAVLSAAPALGQQAGQRKPASAPQATGRSASVDVVIVGAGA